MRNIIPLLALILWACGAPDHVDRASAQQNNPDHAANSQPQNKTAPADSDILLPLGNAVAAGLPTPFEQPGIWRPVAPENLLYLKTLHGVSLIEMAPDFAPHHVQRMRDLATSNYFTGLPFHRVIKDFMAQAGDTSLVRRDPPKTPPLKGEFRFRRAPSQTMIVVGEARSANTGFVAGFAVASQPDALASMTADGKVRAWGLHCPGAAAMARTNDPDSANAEFYITTGNADWLDGTYTVWGRVRAGQNAVENIKLGTPAYPPDLIEELSLGSTTSRAGRAKVWVLRTNTPAFAAWLNRQKNANGQWPDICTMQVPVYVQWSKAGAQPTPKGDQ